eukprot:TRINITY_DN10248_c0_g1_i1.p1 TRINITY_DN10248_c0_g1~~TRINITY_DN10248_c0_g1_i1.p1  ORF type:complete len:478 (+),score=65.25 TRINITY_DN10248_c0_g1_i1:40-1473(+)
MFKLASGSQKRDGTSSILKKKNSLNITGPTNMVHKVHVDMEFNWTGVDPSTAFEIIKKLGDGAYGVVYKARHIETLYVLAVKVVLAGKNIDDLKKEIDILKKCRNNNIVSLYGCCAKDGYLWILMDYCGYGSVTDFLKVYNKPLTMEEIVAIIYNVLQGLTYLHSRGIIHRDLKSGNILLSESGEVKIADFGVSSQLGALNHANTIIGTPLFMSPEVLDGQKYDYSADIWSLGITVIEMSDGTPPHSGENLMRSMMLIASGPPPTLIDTTRWPSDYNNFIARCVKKNPEQRPKAADLLLDPIFSNKDCKAIISELISKHKSQLPLDQQQAVENNIPTMPSSPLMPTMHSSSNLVHSNSKDDIRSKDTSPIFSSPKNFLNVADQNPVIADLKTELSKLKTQLEDLRKQRKEYYEMRELLIMQQASQTQLRDTLESTDTTPVDESYTNKTFKELGLEWWDLKKKIDITTNTIQSSKNRS